MHFSLIEPTGRETPVVVEIPHAGLGLVASAVATMRSPVHALGRDADLFVDRLYADAASEGATVLIAHTSRYVIDLNRSESDVDAEAAEGAAPSTRASRGLIWRLTGDGEQVLGVIREGEVFGEMAFLLERPRTLDVYAASDSVRVLSMSEHTIRAMVAEDPAVAAKLLFNISRMLCVRIVKAS